MNKINQVKVGNTTYDVDAKTIDGRVLNVSSEAPNNSLGNDGDIWFVLESSEEPEEDKSSGGIEYCPASLPSATEEEFDKHKLYLNNGNMYYLDINNQLGNGVAEVKVNLNTPRYNHMSAVVGDNIFIFGGVDQSDNVLSSIEKYNITTNTITTLSVTLPQGVCGGTAIAYGSDIYLIGLRTVKSQGSSSSFKDIYKFNTLDETITVVAQLPYASDYKTTAQLYEGKIYICNGLTIYAYDIKTTTSTSLGKVVSISGVGLNSSSIYNGKIYFFGYYRYAGCNVTNIYEYNISDNVGVDLSSSSSQYVAKLSVGGTMFGVSSYGKIAYIFGGGYRTSEYNSTAGIGLPTIHSQTVQIFDMSKAGVSTITATEKTGTNCYANLLTTAGSTATTYKDSIYVIGGYNRPEIFKVQINVDGYYYKKIN